MLDSSTGLLLTDGGKPGVLSQATGLGFHLSDISIRTGPASQGPPLLPGGLCDSSSWSAPTHTPHTCIPHDIHVYHTPQTHVCTTYNIQSHHTAQVCTPYTTCASHIPHVCSPTHVPCIPHTPSSSSSFIFLQALFCVARAGWLAPAQERPPCAVGMLVRVLGRTRRPWFSMQAPAPRPRALLDGLRLPPGGRPRSWPPAVTVWGTQVHVLEYPGPCP